MPAGVERRPHGRDVGRHAGGGLVVYDQHGAELMRGVGGQARGHAIGGHTLAIRDLEPLDLDAVRDGGLREAGGEVAVHAREHPVAGRKRVDERRLPRSGARAGIEDDLPARRLEHVLQPREAVAHERAEGGPAVVDDGLGHRAHHALGHERGSRDLEERASGHDPPQSSEGGRPRQIRARLRFPMTRDEIPTPALLLDMDRFERNLERMAKHVRAAGKQLRPHAKTHRCPEIAHKQVAAGAVGVACAKLGEAARAAMAPLMDTRARFEADGLPVEIVAGGSTGTHDIDVELGGLTELQSGSYCVMDLDYRRIGGRAGDAMTEFEMALTVATTVVSVPTPDRAMVDGGLKAFSTDKPFPPEAVERPGVEYGFAGDEHGRLTITDPSRAPRLGERIEFFPPHCDPTINLYDRVWCVRGLRVEAVWDIAARGRSA